MSKPNTDIYLEDYTRRLELGGEHYLISFIPLWQTIIYTNLANVKDQGEFKVSAHIPSKKPIDAILINELEKHQENMRTSSS